MLVDLALSLGGYLLFLSAMVISVAMFLSRAFDT